MSTNKGNQAKIDNLILTVLVLVIGFTMFLLVQNLLTQKKVYTDALISVQQSPTIITPNAVLAYSRSMDFAITKTSAIMMGFVLIFTGALLLFKLFNGSINLSSSLPGNVKFDLQTSTPGLALAAFGTIILVVAITTQSKVTLDFSDRVVDPPLITSTYDTIVDTVSHLEGEKIRRISAPHKYSTPIDVSLDNSNIKLSGNLFDNSMSHLNGSAKEKLQQLINAGRFINRSYSLDITPSDEKMNSAGDKYTGIRLKHLNQEIENFVMHYNLHEISITTQGFGSTRPVASGKMPEHLVDEIIFHKQ